MNLVKLTPDVTSGLVTMTAQSSSSCRGPHHRPPRRSRRCINNPEPLVDHWHHSANTTPADLVPFIAEDLNEATERLQRLAQLWHLTYTTLNDATIDVPVVDAMTLRELVHHTAESIVYATTIGTL